PDHPIALHCRARGVVPAPPLAAAAVRIRTRSAAIVARPRAVVRDATRRACVPGAYGARRAWLAALPASRRAEPIDLPLSPVPFSAVRDGLLLREAYPRIHSNAGPALLTHDWFAAVARTSGPFRAPAPEASAGARRSVLEVGQAGPGQPDIEPDSFPVRRGL